MMNSWEMWRLTRWGTPTHLPPPPKSGHTGRQRGDGRWAALNDPLLSQFNNPPP